MNIQQFFALGMKRHIPELIDWKEGVILNLGCGKSPIEGAINLDWPEWDAELYRIDCEDNSVVCVHAYHFIEHLRDPRRMLREIERVLVPGGVVNIVVPHHIASLSYQDLDHKHHFAIETFSSMVKADGYDKGKTGWKLRVHCSFLMAVAERNMAVFCQMIKNGDDDEASATG